MLSSGKVPLKYGALVSPSGEEKPQATFSTDGGKSDPVRLFKLWLSEGPEGMKNTGPLYLSIINRPKSADVWYTKVRMGQNTIGNLMKSMASCLRTNEKLTNHSMSFGLPPKHCK